MKKNTLFIVTVVLLLLSNISNAGSKFRVNIGGGFGQTEIVQECDQWN